MASSSRRYAKGVRVSLGMAGSVGSLRPLRRTEREDSFNTLCPACTEPTKVEQRLTCEHGHGPFLPSECTLKGKKVGDKLVALTPEEVQTVRADDQDGGNLQLSIHPASQVEAATMPTGIAYRFEPDGKNDQFYGVLYKLVGTVRKERLAYVGVMTLRGRKKWFRLMRAAHGLTLVELARPDELHTFEPVSTDFDQKYLAGAMALVDSMTTDFDPELYRDDTGDKVAALVAAKTGTDVPVANIRPAAVVADSLDSLLAASLVAVATKKGEAA